LFRDTEGFQVGDVDLTSSKALSLLDSVPVEDLNLEVCGTTRRLTDRHENEPRLRAIVTYNFHIETLVVPLRVECLLFRVGLVDSGSVEVEFDKGVGFAGTIGCTKVVTLDELNVQNTLVWVLVSAFKFTMLSEAYC